MQNKNTDASNYLDNELINNYIDIGSSLVNLCSVFSDN